VYWWQVARINTSFGFPQTLSEALKMESQQNKIQNITSKSKIKNQNIGVKRPAAHNKALGLNELTNISYVDYK
jgi:hypothetical protein